MTMNDLVVHSEDRKTQIQLYPYDSLEWTKHVDRFGVLVPKTILDRSMGVSKCLQCGQTYSGNQPRCTALRWGYKTASYQSSPTWGHKLVGDSTGYSYRETVVESRQYECNYYLGWSLEKEFGAQQTLFSTLRYLIETLPSEYHPEGFNLTLDQREKVLMHQKIEMLQMENRQIKEVLKEIHNRMQAAGGSLIGVNW